MTEKPEVPKHEQKVLTFEEFSFREPLTGYPQFDGMPCYNNFVLHFIDDSKFDGYVTKHYKNTPHYKRFVAEHSDLAARLNEKMQAIYYNRSANSSFSTILKPLDKELYEAYKIMRGYGASDKELIE